MSASVGVLFMLCVWFVVKKKRASAFNTKKGKLLKGGMLVQKIELTLKKRLVGASFKLI